MPGSMPLVLLSGMGIDERLYAAQQAVLPNLIAVEWIAPLPRESLPAYAQRLAATIDPGTACLVGGCSFGGMVAAEMCRHLHARACLLISSIRSPGELPCYFRVLTHCALLATQPLRLVPLMSRTTLPIIRHVLPRRLVPAVEQLASNPGSFLQWASWAILTWQPSTPPSVPVVAIHGTHDRILPFRNVHADECVEGGGHLLPLTHPEEVSRFLHRQLERFDASTGDIA